MFSCSVTCSSYAACSAACSAVWPQQMPLQPTTAFEHIYYLSKLSNSWLRLNWRNIDHVWFCWDQQQIRDKRVHHHAVTPPHWGGKKTRNVRLLVAGSSGAGGGYKDGSVGENARISLKHCLLHDDSLTRWRVTPPLKKAITSMSGFNNFTNPHSEEYDVG